MNRLKSSNYAVNSGAGWDTSVGAFNTSYDYDNNGNITSLTRNGLEAGTARVIDQLDYTYQGNQLQNVDDAAGWDGFNDRHAGSSPDPDYRYDANGNVTQDLNNGIRNVTYNYLNLPEIETKNGGGYTKNIYDANGVKLAQEVYDENDVLQSRTVFMGEFVYQDDQLKSIQHAEGTIVPDEINGGWEYRYDIKDHVGNTRLTFTTKPKTFDFAASFESENATDEEAYYYNLEETRVTFNSADANSDGGNEVTRVNGTQPMGAGIALFVVPGDTLDMEVYGYYEGGSGYSTQSGLSTMIAAIAGGFGGATGAGATEAQQATYDAFDNALSGIGLIGTSNDNVPAAFLNYILFDENMVMYQNGFVQISTAANGSHELIGLEDILVEKEGLAYVWVSNESASSNWVFFDDMNVTIHEGAVIQREDYYPLGLSYNGFKRYEPDYDGTYKDGTPKRKDLGFRQYDPAIGRFHVIDPLAELQLAESPYQYAGNNPVNNIDALGLLKLPGLKEIVAKVKSLLSKKNFIVVPVNGKKKIVAMGNGRSGSSKGSRSKKKNDNENGSGGSNKNNTADASQDASQSEASNGNNTATASNSQQDSQEDNNPFESFSDRQQAFEPTLRNRNNNTNLGTNRTPRFNPSPVDRKGIDQAIPTNDNPTQVAYWHKEASNAEDLEKLRQDLFSNQPTLQALALLELEKSQNRKNTPASMNAKLRRDAIANHPIGDGTGGQRKDPPTSTPEEALAIIPANGTLDQSEHFPNVDPDVFLDQLRERVAAGGHEKTNQGYETNFCWAAAIAKYGYENDPKGMAEAMIGLYENGTFEYENNNGGMSVPEASQAARDAVGSDVFDDNQNMDEGRTINELDQMLFMTLADHYDSGLESYLNWIDPDYDPGDEENPSWSGAPLSKAVKVLRGFGYDIEVRGSDVLGDPFLTIGDLQEAVETDDVILYVHSGAFKENEQALNGTGTHYIHISSIEQVGDEYRITYWDYGGTRDVLMSSFQFWLSVYGMIQIQKTDD